MDTILSDRRPPVLNDSTFTPLSRVIIKKHGNKSSKKHKVKTKRPGTVTFAYRTGPPRSAQILYESPEATLRGTQQSTYPMLTPSKPRLLATVDCNTP